AADLDNLRKRAKREKEEMRKYGNDKIAMELLPALDNLERALAHAEDTDDSSSIVDGVEMVYRQIVTALKKQGIVGFESQGEKFNPEQHEAIQQVETTEYDTGTIVEQYQKGYFIHDRLLRPALVSVAKRVAGDDNDEHSEPSDASEASDESDVEEPNSEE
ncbi:MAG: nucleotide exchange factor GrpE, partial [Persicimonas sp.]